MCASVSVCICACLHVQCACVYARVPLCVSLFECAPCEMQSPHPHGCNTLQHTRVAATPCNTILLYMAATPCNTLVSLQHPATLSSCCRGVNLSDFFNVLFSSHLHVVCVCARVSPSQKTKQKKGNSRGHDTS